MLGLYVLNFNSFLVLFFSCYHRLSFIISSQLSLCAVVHIRINSRQIIAHILLILIIKVIFQFKNNRGDLREKGNQDSLKGPDAAERECQTACTDTA